jgi:hypothetical protein
MIKHIIALYIFSDPKIYKYFTKIEINFCKKNEKYFPHKNLKAL